MPAEGVLESWEIFPENSFNVIWDRGTSYPENRHIKIVSSSFYPLYDEYSDFKISVNTTFLNNVAAFINVIGDNYENGTIYPASDGVMNSYLVFQNLENLPAGDYMVQVDYALKGKVSGTSDFWRPIESRYVILRLKVTGSGAGIIKTEKQNYVVYYDKDTHSLSGDTQVNIINNTDGKSLYILDTTNRIYPTSEFVNSFTLELFESAVLPDNGVLELSISLLDWGTAVRLWQFNVTIYIIDQSITISPSRLDYYVRKNVNEILTKDINIHNPNNVAFALTAPDWLSVSQTSGSSSGVINVANVSPLTMDIGTYQGSIKVIYLDKEILIPVTLIIVETFDHNFDEDYNFCLDAKILKVLKNKTNAFFAKITLRMKFFIDGQDVITEVPYTIPYFKDIINLNVGEKVHNAFVKNRKSILEEGTIAYHFDNKIHLYPALVDIKIEELDANYEQVNSETIGTKKFYPGKRPLGFPFLTNNLQRSYYQGQKIILSYISGLVKSDNILDVVTSSNGLPNDVIARVKIEDDENKINFSSKKIIKAEIGPEIIYYNMNEVVSPVFIQWENQNLSPESACFTGGYTLPIEYTHLTQKNMFSGEPQKYETLSNAKLLINTGFILKAERNSINEIVKSLFCIIQIDNQYYKGHCISSKLIKEDNKRQLVEFDLEFEIKD
ncbi:MAG: hypothetical protein ACRC0E_10075 [Soonwooa sp.]